MPWWGWLPGVIAGVVCWRVAFRYFVYELGFHDRPNAEDVLLAVVLATSSFVFVPAILVGAGAWEFAKWITHNPNAASVARVLGGESRQQSASVTSVSAKNARSISNG